MAHNVVTILPTSKRKRRPKNAELDALASDSFDGGAIVDKDYKTWWRRGCDVDDECLELYRDWSGYFNAYDGDKDQEDCINEQLWAIREGLA